jgi:hypothetical protein
VSTHEPMTAEARALHAMLDDDWDEAERILRDFLPGELRELERACGQLGVLCADVRRDPLQSVEAGSLDTVPPDRAADQATEILR